MQEAFVDIHCHLLPNIDDGARDVEESLAMAKMAVADGFDTIVATPHQLGTYSHRHLNRKNGLNYLGSPGERIDFLLPAMKSR